MDLIDFLHARGVIVSFQRWDLFRSGSGAWLFDRHVFIFINT